MKRTVVDLSFSPLLNRLFCALSLRRVVAWEQYRTLFDSASIPLRYRPARKSRKSLDVNGILVYKSGIVS